ncbi:hypothetical protein BKA82DRAFT_4167305 [Pisolithus tinctorius]|nr:hypothetical protein BKA82DRAFT_4207617 [Pisolithus tinctorius]KAI6145620.1 hypothetical protein BKA82DRAFT_4167305 [Pisolithus tinctorius]
MFFRCARIFFLGTVVNPALLRSAVLEFFRTLHEAHPQDSGVVAHAVLRLSYCFSACSFPLPRPLRGGLFCLLPCSRC